MIFKWNCLVAICVKAEPNSPSVGGTALLHETYTIASKVPIRATQAALEHARRCYPDALSVDPVSTWSKGMRETHRYMLWCTCQDIENERLSK